MKAGKITSIVAGVSMLAGLTACSGGSSGSGGTTTINWWTWDPDQMAAYTQCIGPFEQANPGIKVKISQYNVADYFTKLTAGFVSGSAPDAFMNSVTYLQAYASQGQIMDLDKYIDQDKLDLNKTYSIGVAGWNMDGKQYALPMDWSTAAIYVNEAEVQKAGLTLDDIKKLTWNLDDGGSFEKTVKHLTVDKNGVRGDQPGFDAKNIAIYGLGNIEDSSDAFGQNTWGGLLATAGINITNKPMWPTEFDYGNPDFIKGVSRVRDLTDAGYSPALKQFTTGGSDQIGSGKVAMLLDGTWTATQYSKLPGVKIGIAPLPTGPNGKRALITNSNGNNIWAGTKNPDATWKWVSYQESEACQTMAASHNGSFFPSIKASMDALGKQQEGKGTDFSVFTDYVKNGELFGSPVYNNGAKITSTFVPMLESYFTNKSDNSLWPKMQEQSKALLAEN